LQQCNQDYDRLYARNPFQFWKQYACNIGIPPALDDAMKHAGTVWMGMDAVADYKAEPLDMGTTCESTKIPRLLVISCKQDFAYPTSNEEVWIRVIPQSYMEHPRFVTLEDCRHYPFYENEAVYGQTLRDFLAHVEGESRISKSWDP
jgi:pimeloyl-ACP methyl ester carboxylesterase